MYTILLLDEYKIKINIMQRVNLFYSIIVGTAAVHNILIHATID